MDRKWKNIILVLIMIVSIVFIGLAINYAKNNIRGNTIDSVVIDDRLGGDKSFKNGMMDGEKNDIGGNSPEGEMPDFGGELPEGEMPSRDIKGNGKGMIGRENMEGVDNDFKADGGFGGAGEALNVESVSLTAPYIIFIGCWSLVFSFSLIYLIMSKGSSQKVFIDSNKDIIYGLSSIILAIIITALVVLVSNKWLLNRDSSIGVEYSSTEDLHIDMKNWNFDESNNVYYQIGLVYASKPEAVEYESLGIYVPGDYLSCNKNGSKYSCEVNDKGNVNGYTAETAPIVFPVNTAGYSAQAAPVSYSYNGLGDYLDAGLIYVYAGCRGRDNGDDYSGGAPWGVTDLKAAVRYIRYNLNVLPGDTERIFAFGMSGGGAQSTIFGATGDSELYMPYLESIGALMKDDEGNTISDAIAGVMAWCPITSLDYANEAYEWNMGQYFNTGTRADSTWTSALSNDLAEAYANYINDLKLVDSDGNVLKLNNSSNGVYTSGTYYEYLKSEIERSLTNYLNDNYDNTADMQNYVDTLNSDETWVSFNSNKKSATITSIEAFVTHCKNASKSVGAFDDLKRSQGENSLFGNDNNNSLHFDPIMANILEDNKIKYSKFSDFTDYSDDYINDLKETDKFGINYEYRMNMYNPMYYLSDYYDGYETSTVAKYWRIRTGIAQGDTANTVEVNLALALENYSSVKSVDFETIWNSGHTMAERTGNSTENFISWIKECTK